MAQTLYRDTGYTLNHLMDDIRVGRIGLPDIQRPFVWSAAKTRDLFDSLYRGYPVGTLMFWETGADVGTRQIGVAEPERSPQLLVVDGQQRLTSLYAVLTGAPILTKAFVTKQIKIAFRPADERFEVTDVAIERDPEFIPDITALWSGSYKATVRDYLARLSAARGGEISREDDDLYEERVDRVRDLRDFRFQVIELGAGVNEEQVAEIFVRTNSEGVSLKQSDFILTLMSVHWEKGRRELEAFARGAVDQSVVGMSARNPFIDPSPDQLLRVAVAMAFRRARLQHVYSLLRGKDLDTGVVSAERRQQQFEMLRSAQEKVLDLANWHEFLKCLTFAGFRSRRMITSENALLNAYVLWLIGRYDFGLDYRALQPVIGRWFFMSHTMGRYGSSPESQLEADLSRLRELPAGDGQGFCDELDRIVRSSFTGDYWDITLPNRLDTTSARSPVLFAYWAALNLLDAELLFSSMKIRDLLDPATHAPRSIERHHLFPKNHMTKIGLGGLRQTNAIANLAFVDWPDNAAISDDAPIDYWPAMAAKVNGEQLKRQCEWHALPIGWEQLDYTTFVERRRDLIAAVVRRGFETLGNERSQPRASTIEDLIATGESQTVEFKSTARWNLHTSQADPKMEAVIAKTVCGFLNAEGGTLLIGVDDDGNVLGLANDFATLGSKANRDGYELFLRQMIDNALSIPTAGIVRIRFETVAGSDVCVVAAASTAKPVFAKGASGSPPSDFWVRIGNATKLLHGDDMVTYQQSHWE